MRAVEQDAERVDLAIREGRFQRWLSLIAGGSSLLAGLEVAYMHYRGSYSQRVMYTPVALSGTLLAAGVAGFFSRTAAKTALPAVSAVTLADAAVGFALHVRGIQRKPGGWRIPLVNIVMGPPLFAPLLFGISGYLGIVASRMRRSSGDDQGGLPRPAVPGHWSARLGHPHEPIGDEQRRREAGLQRHLAIATALSASMSGFEAWYSHDKNNFRFAVQWTPLVVAPLLALSAAAAVADRRVAHTALPAAAALAIANGSIGFGFHVRGVLRRPGGLRLPFYNLMYGPPVFAPLLFAASGFLGVLASLLGSAE